MAVNNLTPSKDATGYYTVYSGAGISDAYLIPDKTRSVTAMLSDIANGNVKMQFTLSQKYAVEDSTAIWHDWSNGLISVSGGAIFDGPISYLRVHCLETVSYTLEILI